MPDAKTFTTSEKRKAIERELRLRRNVYPRMINSGRITPHEASYQLAIFEAIIADYLKLEEAERLL